MLKSIVVDDELKSRESLKKMLTTFCEGVDVLATCQNVKEAVETIRNVKPDVIFLDIQMQGETGFDLLSQLSPINFEVIFTTAYSEFALQAFKVSATDYLLKPIDVAELQHAVEKVKQDKDRLGENIMERMKQLLQNMATPEPENYKLALPTAEGLTFIKVKDIMYLKASGNYTEIFMADGSKQLVSKNLKEYDDLLSPQHFFRTHHSFLVNINCIKSYVKGEGGYVIMNDGASLDVSRRKKEAFLEKIGYKG